MVPQQLKLKQIRDKLDEIQNKLEIFRPFYNKYKKEDYFPYVEITLNCVDDALEEAYKDNIDFLKKKVNEVK